MGPIALALSLALGAWPVLEGDLRTEARSRTPQPGDTSATSTEELQLDPGLAALFRLREGDAALRYAPRLTLVEPSGRQELAVLHSGRAELSQRLAEHSLVRGAATVSWGRTSFSPLLGTSTLPPDRQPAASTLPYLNADAAATLEWAFSGRVRSTTTLGWAANGGATEAARQSLPLQQGPRLAARLSYLEDRRSTLSANLAASRTSFAPGPTANLAVLSALWQTRPDRLTTLEVEAGGAASYTQGLGPERLPQAAAPVAALGLRRGFPIRGQRLEAGLTGRLAPSVDPLIGDVYERAEANLGLGWSPRRELSFDTRANVGYTASGSRAGEGASLLEASATWRPSEHVALGALGRGVYLSQGSRPTGAPWGWLASITVSVIERSD